VPVGETELQSLKEDVAEIKAGVKELSSGLNDLRVLIAGDYVKRDEFEDMKRENNEAHKSIIGWIIGLCVSILGVFSYLVIKGGK